MYIYAAVTKKEINKIQHFLLKLLILGVKGIVPWNHVNSTYKGLVNNIFSSQLSFLGAFYYLYYCRILYSSHFKNKLGNIYASLVSLFQVKIVQSVDCFSGIPGVFSSTWREITDLRKQKYTIHKLNLNQTSLITLLVTDKRQNDCTDRA